MPLDKKQKCKLVLLYAVICSTISFINNKITHQIYAGDFYGGEKWPT